MTKEEYEEYERKDNQLFAASLCFICKKITKDKVVYSIYRDHLGSDLIEIHSIDFCQECFTDIAGEYYLMEW